MTLSETLETEIAKLRETLRALTRSVEAGQPVDMTALEAILQDLCDRARATVPAGRTRVLAALAELEQELGRLAQAIERQIHGTGEATPGRAAAAYGRPQDG